MKLYRNEYKTKDGTSIGFEFFRTKSGASLAFKTLRGAREGSADPTDELDAGDSTVAADVSGEVAKFVAVGREFVSIRVDDLLEVLNRLAGHADNGGA